MLFSKDAHVSQIHYQYISLENLIQQSRLILVAKKLNPFTTEEEIEIHKNREKYPPFKKVISHFNIIKELYNGCGNSYKGMDIKVEGANSDLNLKLHKKYYLQGMGVSPLLTLYESGVNMYNADMMIVFLSCLDDGRIKFSSDGGIESLKKEKEISKLIKKLKKSRFK